MALLLLDYQSIMQNYSEFHNIKITSEIQDKIYYSGVDYSIAGHFDSLQACIEDDLIKVFYESKFSKCFFYFKGEKLHRENGPAAYYAEMIGVSNPKWMIKEVWYQNGVKYNPTGGPTLISKEISNENVLFCKKQWINTDNNLHRVGYPASINYFFNKRTYEYYINGVRIEDNEVKKYKLYYKVLNKLKRNIVKKVLYNSGICMDVSRLVSQFAY
jgi:hypothetical protein